MTSDMRRHRRAPTSPGRPKERADRPDVRTVRLPNGGYYDPDSAGFDDVRVGDVETLFKATTPAEPAAAGSSRS